MNSISLACLHVRCNPMGRTCRQAGEIKNPARARFLFDGCFVFCFATYRLRVLTMCRMVSSTVSRVWSLDLARWSISSSCKTVRGGCTATVQWWSGAGTPYLPTAARWGAEVNVWQNHHRHHRHGHGHGHDHGKMQAASKEGGGGACASHVSHVSHVDKGTIAMHQS